MRTERPSILALLNNALEDFINKGQSSWYPGYVNVDSLFKSVTVLYRYDKGGKATGFGMRLVRVRNLPVIHPVMMLARSLMEARKSKPSLIRAYNTQLEGLVAVLVQMLTGIPAVVSLHGDYDALVWVRGYPSYVRFIVSKVEKLVVRRAKGVWCVTPYVAERAIRLGAPKARVRVIFNKVMIGKFRRSPSLRTQIRKKLGIGNEFVLIHVGRFNVQKNIIAIIRALAYLRKEGRRVKLVLCGDDPPRSMDPPLRPVLAAECKRLGVADHVIFAGFVSNDDLPGYYAAADIFVWASLEIGFGVVLVEAQASGLPIVGSDITYTRSGVVLDRTNSLLFRAKSPRELAQAVLVLMNDASLRRRLSRASLASAKRYDWAKIAKLEAGYYREILARVDSHL